MGRKRQNHQLYLAFMTEDGGEAQRSGKEGTELPAANRDPERPVSVERLMEEICQAENLRKALRKVQSNRGGPGMDGMTVQELPAYLLEHWPAIKEALLGGTYRPQPVKRVEIPKPGGGGVRRLGIPTCLDRFVQQAMLQVLQRQWDPTFSEHSYGFRPGRSAQQTVARAQQYVADGYVWVVDFDLDKFFDRVNHDKLMGRVAQRVRDKRVLRVLRAFLNAGVLEDGLVSPTTEGTPQGGPLSPLLSNLYLDELDSELEERGHRFVRYADDCNIYVKSERAGQRVMASIARVIERRLKLKVNESKSGVDRVQKRKFLGFRLLPRGEKGAKRGLAPSTLKRFKDRVRKITRRKRGSKLEAIVQELSSFLIGWRGYYGYCQTPSVLKKLEGWIRRRLRVLIWKRWKTRQKRLKALVKLGVARPDAAEAAGSGRGPWPMSHSRAVHWALPSAYFDQLGVPRLAIGG